MSNDSGFGVPAGWYPDPLGLPQMRWWDNHGWTEHTTEARAPIVMQETTFAWADDDVPTRRERRERERDDVSDTGTVPPRVPTAEALLQLEPPSWDALPSNEPAPAQATATPAAPKADFSDFVADASFTPEANFGSGSTATADAHTSSVADSAASGFAAATSGFAAATSTGYSPDLDFAQFRATAYEPAFAAQTATAVADAPAATRATAPARTAESAITPHSPAAWIIALIPLLQLVATLLVVSTAGSSGTSVELMLGIWLAPYFVVIPLAFFDRRALIKSGYEKPASWLWSILSAPVYLTARAVSIVMRAGNGFGPILVWGALALLQVGSIALVPGIIIAALPEVFTKEAEASIAHDATVFGPLFTVKCPSPPATQINEQFTCKLTRMGAGQAYDVTASLQRANGWIAWRVDDWGNNGLNR